MAACDDELRAIVREVAGGFLSGPIVERARKALAGEAPAPAFHPTAVLEHQLADSILRRDAAEKRLGEVLAVLDEKVAACDRHAERAADLERRLAEVTRELDEVRGRLQGMLDNWDPDYGD